MKTAEKLVPVSLCPPQIPHGLAWCWTLLSVVRVQSNCVNHGTAIKVVLFY